MPHRRSRASETVVAAAFFFAGFFAVLSVCLATITLSVAARAEEPTPVRAFRHFDTQRAPGLPQSTVMDLHQDRTGLLWIATLDGLGVFDGTEIRPVEPAPDAPVYGSLYSLARRTDGGLWVGGAADVWSWDGAAWRVYGAPGAAQSLAEDGLGRLWRVDQAGGLWRFDPARLDPVGASLVGDGPWVPVPTPDWLGPAVAVVSPLRHVFDPAAGPAAGPEGPAADAAVGEPMAVDARTGPQLWLLGQRGVGFLGGGGRFEPVAGGAPRALRASGAPPDLTAFLVARDGRVWLASSGGVIHHTVAGGWRRVHLPGWQGGHVRALEEDRAGRVWAGGLEGGLAFGRAGEEWTVWDEDNGLRREGVLALLADREGTLWVAANGYGLQQWIGEAWSHRIVWRETVWRETVRREGGLRDERDDRQIVFGITPASGDDGTGEKGFYAAVFARGVWHWDGERMHAYGEADGLVEDVRSVFEPEPGRLWVSARFGIYERPAPGEPFRWLTRVPSGFVYGVQRAPDGSFWAHTSAHGLLIRRAGETEWHPHEDLHRHLPDRDVKAVHFRRGTDEVWVGTLGGLVVFRQGRPVPLSSDVVTALPSAVQAIHEDPLGDVWVAGFGGLSRIPGGDLSAPVETLTRADGLASHTVYSLASTGARPSAVSSAGSSAVSSAGTSIGEGRTGGRGPELWIGGSDGLARLPLTGPGAGGDLVRRLRLYDATDGLIDDECNHSGLYPAPDGSLYLGTMASLARFDPASESSTKAPLHVTWLERPDPGAKLPAGRRTVSLRWHAPWLAPEPVEYRTRVPRLGEDWSEPSGRARLDLGSLGPGVWRVEVSARLALSGTLSGAGAGAGAGAGTAAGAGAGTGAAAGWGEGDWTAPVSTTFRIEPYFHETPAFWALCALLLAALVVLFVRWRTARLRRRARELQAAVDEALARIKVLGGLLPICAGCKKVRDDEGYWQQIESYLHVHSEAELSHGLCPDCASEMYGAYLTPGADDESATGAETGAVTEVEEETSVAR